MGDDQLDAKVCAEVRAGRHEEYRHLVRAYQQEIYAMIMRQIGDEQAALELTQDAFIRAFKGLAKFRGDASFKTWLIRIALKAEGAFLLRALVGTLFNDVNKKESGAARARPAPLSAVKFRPKTADLA